jgi:hypothetical protein
LDTGKAVRILPERTVGHKPPSAGFRGLRQPKLRNSESLSKTGFTTGVPNRPIGYVCLVFPKVLVSPFANASMQGILGRLRGVISRGIVEVAW